MWYIPHGGAQILILEISNIFLRLKFSPSLTLDKIEHFETGSYRTLKFESSNHGFLCKKLCFPDPRHDSERKNDFTLFYGMDK